MPNTETTIVVVMIIVAVLLLVRQIYLLATGKKDRCSCCRGCQSQADQCPTTEQPKKDEDSPQD
ncbi:MAG: hypothetical protein K8S55_15360 [Phycisphaerae bacterium]|nr:hypothetical protein [Phycisphaerae bacterium]